MSKNGHARRLENRHRHRQGRVRDTIVQRQAQAWPAELGVLLYTDTYVSSEIIENRRSATEGNKGEWKARLDDGASAGGKLPFPVFRIFGVGMAPNLSTGFRINLQAGE